MPNPVLGCICVSSECLIKSVELHYFTAVLVRLESRLLWVLFSAPLLGTEVRQVTSCQEH